MSTGTKVVWFPIKEVKPRYGQMVLAWYKGFTFPDTAVWLGDKGWATDAEFDRDWDSVKNPITHWRQLPEGPDTKDDTMRRTSPVLCESRKELFSGIETSPEFSSAGFYERHPDIKKTQSKGRKEMIELYNEDCLIKMKDIPDKSIDMILCDLPYGTTACKWDTIIPFEPLWEAYKRIIKHDGAIVLFGNEPFSSFLRLSNLKMFKYDWIWEKSKCGSAFTSKYRPQQKHETISVFGNGKINYFPQMTQGTPYYRKRKANTGSKPNNHNLGVVSESETINIGERYPKTVQFFQQKWRRQDQVHPTQKPVALMEYLIRTYTKEGETVLDNTMGSGTTGVACVNLNRRFIGIEKDEGYFKVSQERIQKAQEEKEKNDKDS